MSDLQHQPEPPASAGGVVTDVATDAPDWSAYLATCPKATIFHDPRWGAVLRDAYRRPSYYLTARRGGRVVGVLQLVHQKSLLFGSYLCSIPYFDAAGILADDAEARASLLAAAGELRQKLGATWVELRQIEPLAELDEGRTDKVTLQMPLPRGRDAMWDQLKSKVRTKVRKSQKLALTIHAGGAELVGEFHAVYARAMRDLGSPPHSRRYFATIVQHFADAARLFVTRSEGRAIAASFALKGGRFFHVPWSGSDRRRRGHEANRFMWWEMMAAAADTDAEVFDFGRSTKGAGTYEFKKEWSAEDVQLYWQYIVAEGASPSQLRPDSGKFHLMTACWRKLPVWAAKAIGPRIISRLC